MCIIIQAGVIKIDGHGQVNVVKINNIKRTDRRNINQKEVILISIVKLPG